MTLYYVLFQTCTYNSRRLGGFLAIDHKSDLLRSVVRAALKKPSSTSSASATSYLLDPSSNLLTPVGGGTVLPAGCERINNVKPLLARKLQATVPLATNAMVNRDAITVATGYNGHIQVATANNLGLVGNVTNPQLKRSLQHVEPVNKNNSISLPKTKTKKSKVCENGPGLNIMSNVVQLDPSGGAKNHSIPVVAVSIPNGLAASQTFNLTNVNLSNVRSCTQPIRIHPSSMKTLIRDGLDGRSLGSPSAVAASSEGGNSIVLGSAGATSYLISDKSLKTDSSGSIRLELHPNTFTADSNSRFLHATQLSKGTWTAYVKFVYLT